MFRRRFPATVVPPCVLNAKQATVLRLDSPLPIIAHKMEIRLNYSWLIGQRMIVLHSLIDLDNDCIYPSI